MTTTSRKFPRLLKLAVYVTYSGLLGTAAVAVWIGIVDVFLPVSLSAQLVGLSYLLAGVAGLAGAVLLICKTKMLWQEEEAITFTKWQFRLAGAGVVAGLYVDITIALSSFRYELVKAYIFAALALALLGLLLAYFRLPIRPKLRGIGKALAGAGVSAGLLTVAAQFWYQNFYLPGSVQVGIEYSLSAGPVVQSGSNRFVTLRFTMKNVSSVAAIELNSMLIVTGLSYTNGTNSGIASPAVTQRNMIAYAQTLPSRSFYFSIPKLPDIGFSGRLAARTLAAWRPIGNNANLLPDVTYSRDFVVVIPERGIQAIDARVKIIYARATRLTLGASLPGRSGMRHPPDCKNSEQFAYHIVQSALHRFTDGSSLIFITNWCADITHPDISVRITGIPGMNQSPSTLIALFRHYVVNGNTFIRTFVLGPVTNASP
jgi:hypothetical protein